MLRKEKNLILVQIGFSLVALFIGVSLGPLQAWEKASINLYPAPIQSFYYAGLTLHGILNALVFTTIFITGFQTFATLKGLQRPLKAFKLALVGVALEILGSLLATVMILVGKGAVLYTFYPPMKADPLFYIGLTLLVVGSWLVGWSQMATLAAWRKENPGIRTPLIAMGSMVNTILWQLATLGIAVQMIFLLIPWALNLVPATDVLLNRVLFWFTGHPLVYFWLLPAYVSWYGMLPKQAGGKLFSDSLARLAFWGFLIFSTPVGFHHQFADPGIPVVWKYIHTFLTFLVIIPSFMTAFTVLASLERSGRKKGATGLLGWIKKLPWKDPSVVSQLLAGLVFFFGGIGGIINASATLNNVIHNTTWVPGHFHLTVATASALSFMGITYWLIPHLTGKPLRTAKVALISAWTWFIGMVFFSLGMHWMGLLGAPRRVPLSAAAYTIPNSELPKFLTAIGGVFLLVGGILYFWTILRTWLSKKLAEEPIEAPIAESEIPTSQTPAWLDNWKLWIIIAVVFVLIGYGPSLIQFFTNPNFVAPGFKVW